MATPGKSRKKAFHLANEINLVVEEVNEILNSKNKDRYFEGIAILHSFIEDMLKWLVITQMLRNHSTNVPPPEEVRQINNYCHSFNFFSLLKIGLSVGLLDGKLFEKLSDILAERNELVRQYGLYIHNGKRQIFRKKLEKLSRVANVLVSIFNEQVEDIGILDDSYFGNTMDLDFAMF